MTIRPTKVRSKDGRFAAVCLFVFFVLHAGEALVDCCQSHTSASERIASWDFSSDDDRNFDNVPHNWTRTYDRQHPRYLKLEIVPYDRNAENSLIQYDSVVLRGWLAARAWIEQLPEEGWIVSSTPSLLRITRSSLRLLPNLPPSITDKLSNRYLRGEVNGGAITSTSPAIAVEIDHSYRLRARMRTEDVVHNNAWADLVFYDSAERPIATIPGPRLQGTTPWTQIDIGPASPPVGATTARIVLHFAPMDRADLSGSVGFDDLWLDRSPRIRVETNADRGLYTPPAKPMVRCIVSGIRGEGKSIEFKLFDEAGTQIQTAIVPLHLLSNADNDGNFKQRIQVDGSELAGVALWNLDDVTPGFYQVQAAMVQQNVSPFSVTQTFAVLGELPISPGPFGWSLLAANGKEIPTRELPEWLEDCRV